MALTDQFVFEYFSQLNPIAHKIQAEINQTIENYESHWNTLDAREQVTIINEAVIKPEVSLNYYKNQANAPKSPAIHPYRDIDASLLNYFVPRTDVDRPFSYKTRSQENLFLSFKPGDTEQPSSAVRLPTARPKNNQLNKSTDSLTCVNLVTLNFKAKKGRAPPAPTKPTTKPPPPPPPTNKAKVITETSTPPPVAVKAPPVVVKTPPVVIKAPPPPPPTAPPVLEDIPKIPEDSNSNSSLLSPAEAEEEQPTIAAVDEEVNAGSAVTTEPSDNETDEFKSLLDTNGFDFLNNW